MKPNQASSNFEAPKTTLSKDYKEDINMNKQLADLVQGVLSGKFQVVETRNSNHELDTDGFTSGKLEVSEFTFAVIKNTPSK